LIMMRVGVAYAGLASFVLLFQQLVID